MKDKDDLDFEAMMNHLDKNGIEYKDDLLDEQALETKNKYRKKQKESTAPQRRRSIDEAALELDMHGLSVDEAEFEFCQAIVILSQMKEKTLRIIHGGSGGHYGPVKTHIHFLLTTKFKNKIRLYKIESHNDGSTWVELK